MHKQTAFRLKQLINILQQHSSAMDSHGGLPYPLSMQPPETAQPVDTTSVKPPGNSEYRIAPDGEPAPKMRA